MSKRRRWKPRPKRKNRRRQRSWFSPRYVKWRKSVYRRDNWQCQWPGCGLGPRTPRKRKIEAHHILPWRSHRKVRFVVSNGITLCHEHHESIEGRELDFASGFFRHLKNSRIERQEERQWLSRQVGRKTDEMDYPKPRDKKRPPSAPSVDSL